MQKTDGKGAVSFQEELYLYRAVANAADRQNVSRALLIDAVIDIPLLTRALRAVVRVHEACRTGFKRQHESFVRSVADVELLPSVIDLSARDPDDTEVRQIVRAFAERAFDVEEVPLVRVLMAHVAGARSILMVAMSHIVADIASVRLLLHNIEIAYRALLKGEQPRLQAPPYTLSDFAYSHRAWMTSDDYRNCLASLRTKYARCLEKLEVTTAPIPKKPWPCEASTVQRVFPQDILDRLRDVATSHGATVASGLLAVTTLTLAKTSQRRRLFFSMACANRHHKDLSHLVGFLATTLLEFVDLDDYASAGAFIAGTHKQAFNTAFRYGLVPQRAAAEIIASLEREFGFAKSGARPLSEVIDITESTSRLTHFAGAAVSLYAGGRQRATNDIKIFWNIAPASLHLSVRVPSMNLAYGEATTAALADGLSCLSSSALGAEAWRTQIVAAG